MICRTKLTGSEIAEGSVFLFRHTGFLYGDFSLDIMEVNEESVARLPKARI